MGDKGLFNLSWDHGSACARHTHPPSSLSSSHDEDVLHRPMRCLYRRPTGSRPHKAGEILESVEELCNLFLHVLLIAHLGS